jgi:hypothetical protein
VACEGATKINGYPTFIIVHSGAVYQARVEQMLESFSELIEGLKALDPMVTGRRDFRQWANCPVIAISFRVDDAAACAQLIDIGRSLPNSTEHLLLGIRRNATKMAAYVSRDFYSEWQGVVGDPSILVYVRDYLHVLLSNRDMAEPELILIRCFGFMVQTGSHKSGALLSTFESKTTRITGESQFIETSFPRSGK